MNRYFAVIASRIDGSGGAPVSAAGQSLRPMLRHSIEDLREEFARVVTIMRVAERQGVDRRLESRRAAVGRWSHGIEDPDPAKKRGSRRCRIGACRSAFRSSSRLDAAPLAAIERLD
jgi:hypothetical protein